MSRRPPALSVWIGALAIVAVIAVSGCSTDVTASHTAEPVHSTQPSKGSTPVPSPTPTFDVQTYTCDSILPPPTLAVFKSKESAGFTVQTDYLQRMQNIGSNLVMFSSYGGILCQWAYPDAENSVDYAFSPITASEASTQQSTLTQSGYAASSKYHGTLYSNPDSTDYPDEYLFIPGYWFQASSDDVMQLIVDNVFTTTP